MYIQNEDKRDYIPHHQYYPEVSGVEAARNFCSIMSTRRSVRHFSSEPIDRNILYYAIKTASSAPSGANCQPWFFALIESPGLKKSLRIEAEKVETNFYTKAASEEWLKDLKPLGTCESKPFLEEAPALVAIFSRHRLSTEDTLMRSYYPRESVGIATGFLLSCLHHAGLSTLTHTPHPMGFLNQELGLDQTYRPYLIVAVGKPCEKLVVPNLERKGFTEICKLY